MGAPFVRHIPFFVRLLLQSLLQVRDFLLHQGLLFLKLTLTLLDRPLNFLHLVVVGFLAGAAFFLCSAQLGPQLKDCRTVFLVVLLLRLLDILKLLMEDLVISFKFALLKQVLLILPL